MKDDAGGTVPRAERFFCNDGEVFPREGKTYVLSSQWGNKTLDAARSLSETYPNLKIRIKPSD